MKYLVFNWTDGLIASPESYEKKKDAEEFKTEFREKFQKKGYYFTSKMERIPADDLELKVIPEKDLGKYLHRSRFCSSMPKDE